MNLQDKITRALRTLDLPANIPAAVKAKIDAKSPVVVDDFSYVSKI